MNEGDVDSFVAHSRRIIQRAPSMSGTATELRVVVPFLRTLGWDPHGREVVPDHPVETGDGTRTVDYALCVDRTPEVFVVTAAAAADLGPETGQRLTDAMAAAGVEWGIATNGRSFAFLAHEGEEERRVGCDLAELPGEREVLAHYARETAVERRDERARTVRTEVADAIAEDRAEVVETIHRALVPEDGGDAIEGELRAASEAFVDGVLSALSDGRRPAAFADGASPGEGTPPDGGGEARSGGDGGTPTDGDAGDGATADGSGAAAGDADDGSPDTEYVVRFFNGRSSVGAVGHSRSGEAMAQAIEYMIEQHALDSRLTLPWGEDDGRALLNHDPVHPDGTEMADARQLSNGYYVDTAVDVDVGRAAVEQLADQSGLRVLFRGDWPEGE